MALFAAGPARAAVTISFYSHDFRIFSAGFLTNFPHGFILLSGAPDDGTPALTGNFGFSATDFSVSALWTPVEGQLDRNPLPAAYIAAANRHFTFTLSDAEYHAVMAVVEKWRAWPQPSYDIDRHNCVTFVKELASAAGLTVSDHPAFVRKPREFLDDVALRNAAFLGEHGNVIQVSAGVDALRERTRQLEGQARAAKERSN